VIEHGMRGLAGHKSRGDVEKSPFYAAARLAMRSKSGARKRIGNRAAHVVLKSCALPPRA
jgi:hypothetical protein